MATSIPGIGDHGAAPSHLSPEPSAAVAPAANAVSGESLEEAVAAGITPLLLDFVRSQLDEARLQFDNPLVKTVGESRPDIDEELLNDVLDAIENAFKEDPP